MGQLAASQNTRVFPSIKVRLKVLDNAINLERAAKGDYDTQLYCYIHEPTAVGMLKTAYHSKGGRNQPRLNDPKMDELLDQAGRELDGGKRTQLLREAQLRALEDLSFMPVMHNASMMAEQSYVRDLRLGGATRGYGKISQEV